MVIKSLPLGKEYCLCIDTAPEIMYTSNCRCSHYFLIRSYDVSFDFFFFFSLKFKLILTNLDKALASGLQMTAMVEYHPDKDEDTFDQLLISIGNKTIEIPLVGYVFSILHANIFSTLKIKIRVKVIFCIFSG